MRDVTPFIRAILDHPDDDAPRLVLADFLEERGSTQGEFIRLQCERARLNSGGRRYAEVVGREQELLRAHGPAWLRPMHALLEPDRTFPGLPLQHAEFRRGLVEAVRVDARAFLRHADELMVLGPVREVCLVVMEDDAGAARACSPGWRPSTAGRGWSPWPSGCGRGPTPSSTGSWPRRPVPAARAAAVRQPDRAAGRRPAARLGRPAPAGPGGHPDRQPRGGGPVARLPLPHPVSVSRLRVESPTMPTADQLLARLYALRNSGDLVAAGRGASAADWRAVGCCGAVEFVAEP